jgi:protein involved in polysaccharide export with SLBB domain
MSFLFRFAKPQARIAVLALFSAVVPAPGLAQNPRASPPEKTLPQPEQDVTDDLAGAERLKLRFVNGNPELTGEYIVNFDQTISIPVLGRIPLTGMTAASLEKMLASRASQIANQDVYVTLEIAGYKPVFVTGSVKNSGSTPWQPGLTVLQAIAQAGGINRGEGAAALPGKADAEVLKLRKATDDQKRVLAVLARLAAEQSNSKTIEVPPRLAALVGKREAEQLIDSQRSLLASRTTSLESQLAAIERGRDLTAQEIAGLEAQKERIDEQLDARRKLRDAVISLRQRGIATASRTLEEDVRVSDLEERKSANSVALARVQATVAQFERDRAQLQIERRAANDAEIGKLERDVAQLQLDIDAAKAAIDDARDLGAAAADEHKPRSLMYQIVRRGLRDPLDATPSSVLKPGDTLVVSLTER